MKIIKILWVDDMEDWVLSAKSNLEIIASKYGIELVVLHVKNGEDDDLHLKLRDFDSDCIVMDYMMEPFNGDRYVKMIRNDDDYEHLSAVPIIFYSQATDIDLKSLVKDLSNVHTVYRANLEEKIKEMFFK
jgi:CheY-like chemotaxis protein